MRQHSDGRARFEPEFVEAMSERQNHRCCYCGVRMRLPGEEIPSSLIRRDAASAGVPLSRYYIWIYATVEHVVPKSIGGSDDESNLVIACRRCNSRRGSAAITQELLMELQNAA